MGRAEYAIVDTETTGLFPDLHDRVIEIGIVRINQDGEVLDEYSTLVNPKRDVGKTSLHGIKAGYLLGAPLFEEVAGDVLSRLQGAVIVGHNLYFDWKFIRSEFGRICCELPEDPGPHLCTMRLSYDVGLHVRSLVECCAHFGIDLEQHHSALHDARATASLLGAYISSLHDQSDRFCFNTDCRRKWPTIPPCGVAYPREKGQHDSSISYLARLVQRLPDVQSADVAVYLDCLDRVLEDRCVTPEEAEELLTLAQSIGLSRDQAIEAHRQYLLALARAAWADGVVTGAERRDLEEVTCLLGFGSDELEHALAKASIRSGEPSQRRRLDLIGKTICFTGQLTSSLDGVPMCRAMAEDLVESAGMTVRTGVSRALDFLIVADPNTQSGKAKKAREYGTRILAEAVLWRELGIPVD